MRKISSLLSSMSVKERKKYIVKEFLQLHNFRIPFARPSTPKRLSDKREKYHIHLRPRDQGTKDTRSGDLKLKMNGTPVYVDVERYTDRDFFYLLGVRFDENIPCLSIIYGQIPRGEQRIWIDFLKFSMKLPL